MLRGGSWFNSPSRLRSACRGGSSSGYRGDDDGFRVARAVTIGTTP
jgi:formylglycine-generating enzyme required for sulfatase activity